MTSEIQQDLEENYKIMKILIDKQEFTIGAANDFLERYFNIIRKMEDLEASRDNWKKKYNKLKEAQNENT